MIQYVSICHDVMVDDPDSFSIVIVTPGEGMSIYVMSPSDGECYNKIQGLIISGASHAIIAREVEGWLNPIVIYRDTPVVLFPDS